MKSRLGKERKREEKEIFYQRGRGGNQYGKKRKKGGRERNQKPFFFS